MVVDQTLVTGVHKLFTNETVQARLGAIRQALPSKGTGDSSHWGKYKVGTAAPSKRIEVLNNFQQAVRDIGQKFATVRAYLLDGQKHPERLIDPGDEDGTFKILKDDNQILADSFRALGNLIDAASEISQTTAQSINNSARAFVNNTSVMTPLYLLIQSGFALVRDELNSQGLPKNWVSALPKPETAE